MVSTLTPDVPILDDAEWTIMATLAAGESGPLGLLEEAALLDAADARSGFDRERLAKALSDLQAKEVLISLGAGAVQVTQAGRDLLVARGLRRP